MGGEGKPEGLSFLYVHVFRDGIDFYFAYEYVHACVRVCVCVREQGTFQINI